MNQRLLELSKREGLEVGDNALFREALTGDIRILCSVCVGRPTLMILDCTL